MSISQIQFIGVDPEEERIKILKGVEALLNDFKKSFNQKSQTEIETPLQLDEVVLMTGYTKPTLYLYCQKNTLPHHKKNGRLFFFKSEIVEWIRTGKQKTLKEIEADTDVYLTTKKKG